MYDRPTLGLDEAMRGMLQALEAAAADGDPIAIAIADHRGELVCCAAQDQVIEVSRNLAPRKAYTAAIGRQDIPKYRSKVKNSTDIPLELLLGPRATSAQGGVPILTDLGLIVGGVGVSGAATPARDEELARTAIAGMGLRST